MYDFLQKLPDLRAALDAYSGPHRALIEHYASGGGMDAIEGYSDRCLRRVWKAVRFSWWMTNLLHRFPDNGEFGRRVQQAELDYLCGSRAAATALAENYVGLPFED